MKQGIVMMILWAMMTGACATTDQVRTEVVRGWEGKSVEEVTAHFGPPAQELADGQGGRMLLYGPGGKAYTIKDFQGQGSYFRGKDLEHIFWVDGRGVVYRVWTAKRGRF